LPAGSTKKMSEKFSDFQEKFVDIKFSEFVRKFFRTQIIFLIGLSPALIKCLRTAVE
jgi:hypothetical protein